MFRFRLERVLQYRRRRLEARTRELAATQMALHEAVAAATAATGALDRSRQQAANARRGTLDPPELARQLAWHEYLAAEERRRLEAVALARAELAGARTRLTQAWRECEVLRRLRERQRREWQQTMDRRERRALDEIGSIRAALAQRRADAITA
jgi:flagellar export protein FliJ